ncbi:hypothetical protein ACFV46_23115 [Streptomyces sp. NPDC059852]|uniref:hypothetical protein n=1 Tax=Streptomyces sp. NPDC059852 TaxID=3346972 RepID=UPI0036660773
MDGVDLVRHRHETLTADGQVHVDGRPTLGEPWFEGEDAPDYNPICHCPRLEAVLHGVRGLCRLRAVPWPAHLAPGPDLITKSRPHRYPAHL